MAENQGSCTTCGRPYDDEYPAPLVKKGLLVPVLSGGAIGLFAGTAFVAWWFKGWYQLVEAHTFAGFTHQMALIHETAGTALGLLGGYIYGVIRRR